MPIGKAVGLLLDFLFLPSMRVGQDVVRSSNSAVSELLQNLQFFMATDINKIAKNIKRLVGWVTEKKWLFR